MRIFFLIFQVMRDLGFMIPDILHLYFPWQELKDLAKKRGGSVPRPSHLIATRDVAVAVSSVFTLWLFCALVVKD